MTDRTARRREKLVKGFKADRIDAMLVQAVPNVSYLTGFTGDSSVLVVTPRAVDPDFGRAVYGADQAGVPRS